MTSSIPFWDQPELEKGGVEVPTVVKNDEEIAKFTVDEHLSDVERTVLFLNTGHPVQQKHAIINLPSVVRGRGRAAFEAIAQPLKSALSRLDADAQIATAEAFATIARDRLLTPAEMTACLLPMVTRNLNKQKSNEESNAWLGALCEMIPLMEKEVLRTDVASLATSKGDVEENVHSRVMCAQILAALAPQLTREDVEVIHLKKALRMCQDVDYLVRISMCRTLGPVARSVGKESAVRTVLPELLELLNDEEVQVQIAAYSTIASIIDMLPADVRKQRVVPTLLKHMQPIDVDVTMSRCIAGLFGPIMWLVRSDLEPDEAQVFYACYKHMSSKSDPELRKICAVQFPAVLKAAATMSSHSFQTTFQDCYYNLVADPNIDVRIAVAAQLHDVARQVGRDCPMVLTRPLVRLLRDEVQEVQAALLPMITATLQNWVLADETKRDSSLGEIVRAVLDLESSTGRNWRMHFNLASAFPGFTQVFSSDQIHEQFLPMAMRLLANSAAAVRPAAAEGVACFFRSSRREKQRGELFLRLIREFGRSKTYTARIAFSEVAAHLLRLLSARFIKEFVFDLCLELLYDPVPNVRLITTALLPRLKLGIKLPEDVDLLERLNNAMSNAMTDNDRDVSQTARAMNETFKRSPVRMMVASSSMDNSINGGLGGLHFSEAEDRRKEEEELDFTFCADDLKEIRSELASLRRRGLLGHTTSLEHANNMKGAATAAGHGGIPRRVPPTATPSSNRTQPTKGRTLNSDDGGSTPSVKPSFTSPTSSAQPTRTQSTPIQPASRLAGSGGSLVNAPPLSEPLKSASKPIPGGRPVASAPGRIVSPVGGLSTSTQQLPQTSSSQSSQPSASSSSSPFTPQTASSPTSTVKLPVVAASKPGGLGIASSAALQPKSTLTGTTSRGAAGSSAATGATGKPGSSPTGAATSAAMAAATAAAAKRGK